MSEAPLVSHRIRRVMRQAAEAMSRGEFIVARDLARRVTEGAPEFTDGWMMFTDALAELGQFDAGLEHIEQAISLHPEALELKVQRCKFLMGMARREECLAQVRALREKSNLSPWALDTLGLFLSMLDQVPEAAEVYEQLCQQEPDNPENQINLGMARLALGQMDSARGHAERALSIAPGFPRALALIANLRTATTNDNNVATIQAALDRSRALPERVSLGYALGKECDDLERWDDAFSAFSAAGEDKRRMMPYDQQGIDDLVDQLMEHHDQAFAMAADTGWESTRPIFVFGMPRSGTTLVERILGAHEQVVAGGELRDFMDTVNRSLGRAPGVLLAAADVAGTTRLDPARLGREYIESVCSRVGTQSHFTDKLPLNFMYLGLIARALPGATLVHVKRNPMDVIFSNFKILFADLNAYSYSIRDTATYYVAYHRLMTHWESLFEGRMHTVRYEHLVDDTEGDVRRLLDHCRLPWQARCLESHRDRSAVTTASAVQVRNAVYGSAVGHWRNYEHLVGDAMQVLDDAGIAFR